MSVTRRSVIKAGAWAAPVVALAATAPLAAASGELLCEQRSTQVSVHPTDAALLISFLPGARNSIDVTIRQAGYAEQHFNYVPAGTPTNSVPHMRNYTPGDVAAIPLPRPLDPARDWFQVEAIHLTDCVARR